MRVKGSAGGDRLVTAVLRPLFDTPELAPFPDWLFGQPRRRNLAFRARHVIYRAARLGRIRTTATVPWLCNTRVQLMLGSDFGFAVFAGSCFEPDETYLLSKLLSPGSVFVDVGANMGLYSILAAALVKDSGRVVAVEPSSRERALLEHNIGLNGFENLVVDSRALIDVESGHRQLHVTDLLHSGQNTFGAVVYDKTVVVSEEEIEVTTLDNLLASHQVERVDVVKIDVEGAEFLVLLGASRTLSEMKPVLLMELQETSLAAQGSSSAAVVGLLEQHGYEVYAYGLGPPVAGAGASAPATATDTAASDHNATSSLLPEGIPMHRLSEAEVAASQNIVAVPSAPA